MPGEIATYLSFVVIAGLIVLNIAGRSDLIKPGMIQAVAVLPFSNYTGDDRLDYVADGMHASLIYGHNGKVQCAQSNRRNLLQSLQKTRISQHHVIGEELRCGSITDRTSTNLPGVEIVYAY
jgi:hypothetical protein